MRRAWALAVITASLWLARPCPAQEGPAKAEDGFSWSERGWSLLAQRKFKDASDAFSKAIERSATLASQAEANLGLGITALAGSKPQAAKVPLRNALIQGPYVLPVASYETALTALAMGDDRAALAFLQQGLDVDPLFPEALRELAKLHERLGDFSSAFRDQERLLALNPADPESAEAIKNILRRIRGLPPPPLSRHLAQPLVDAEGKNLAELIPANPTIRVVLFSDEGGAPVPASRLSFMTNAPFSLYADGEAVLQGRNGLENWRVVFNPDKRGVEVRDSQGNLRYEGKARLRVTAAARQPSVLVRSAEFSRSSGFDAGDREMRGELGIVPGEGGVVLINELPLEAYLYGAVGSALRQGSPPEAYKAQAVVSRTMALWYKSQASSGSLGDICDSQACQKYSGVNDEMGEASQAVAATRGVTLSLEGRPARLMEHENCGGLTEDGKASGETGLDHLSSVSDGPETYAPPRTEEELRRWTHEFPPAGAYCESNGRTSSAGARWIRVLGARKLQERAKGIGELRDLRVLKRSATGRVLALEAAGSRGSLTLEGEKKISDFLSPGSLRSTLFTIEPLMKGDERASFIMWGAGTGTGLGMCKAGVVGQAAAGKDYKAILAHYFPALKLGGVP